MDFDAVDALVVVLNAHHEVVRFNTSCQKFYSRTEQQAKGQSFDSSWFHPAEVLPAVSAYLKAEDFSKPLWVRGVLNKRAISLRWSFRHDEDQLVATAHDFADQNVLEETVLELEATNRELESFSYSVAHDLRAPVRHIEGFATVMLQQNAGKLDADGRRVIEIIQRSAQRMTQLIEDLLQLSRISRRPLRSEKLDLSLMVREVSNEIISNNPDRQIAWNIDEGLKVRADAALMRLALFNLLSNAVKYTGKRVEAVVEVGLAERSQRSALFIRDNGAGFDSKLAGRLGQPFQRMHAESEFPGVGIGLATVNRVLARHQGSLDFEAKPNEGAVFFLILPGLERR